MKLKYLRKNAETEETIVQKVMKRKNQQKFSNFLCPMQSNENVYIFWDNAMAANE